MRSLAIVLLALAACPRVAAAQEPAVQSSLVAEIASVRAQVAQPTAFRVHSLGQPPIWQLYATGSMQFARGAAGAQLVTGGVQRPLFNPVVGLAAVAAEGYYVEGGRWPGGGLRLVARSPALAIGFGADASFGHGRKGRVDAMITYQSAIRRGGIVGAGTMIRADWLPTRGRAFNLGLHAPLNQPLAGRTRSRQTAVVLPAGASSARELLSASSPGRAVTLLPETERALAEVAAGAHALRAVTSLRTGSDVARLRDVARGMEGATSYQEATRLYHAGIASAFSSAGRLDGAGGEAVAARARAGLLEHVIIPYDTLFGRPKRNDGIGGLAADAQASFERWLRDSSAVDATAHPALAAVHARLLGVVASVHGELAAAWRDSRMIWLPLRLALRPEQLDDQAEVDSMLGRLAGRPFTDGNTLTYLRSAEIPLEIARSIYAARDYHVLWMHDFVGIREETNDIDGVSFEMVADAYFPALTAAVRRYEEGGRFPTYMILLDQHYYEERVGRLWMTILEDPLNARISLPRGNEEREAHLRMRQRELRDAVAAASRLRGDATAAGTTPRELVKVHVSILFPGDFSFRSHRIIPWIPFTPDNVMREHRKIVLHDASEADPLRGGMMTMGMGIGEHYANPTWEDRGFRLRGPAVLEARTALRRLLARHGFDDTRLPVPLRATDDATRVEDAADAREFVGRALQVHNEVGFGSKRSSVIRAALYDMAAPGTVLVIPDPLWLSAEWAAMLTGAAARGARVHVISPADRNAPSSQPPIRALARDVMEQFLERRRDAADVIRASGGELRIGFYAAAAHVDDPDARRREISDGLARAPWIRDLFPFDDRTIAVLDRAEWWAVTTGTDGGVLTPQDDDGREPQLHQKTQLIARPEAIAALLRVPGWDEVLARQMESQSRGVARFSDQVGYEVPAFETEATRSTDAMLTAYERALPESERRLASFYFSVGNQNMDPRGLALDGEATIVTSGFQGISGLVDSYFLVARSTWIDDTAELDRFIAPRSAFWRWVGRLLRPVF